MLGYPVVSDVEEALKVAISGPFLTHKINGPQEAHAMWVLVGFGLGQLYPDEEATVNAIPVGSILSGLPWGTIVATVIKIILSSQGVPTI